MRLIITFFILLGSLSLSAQSFSGNLMSESTNEVLSYGNVDIFQGDKLVASVLTDKFGNFNVALDTGSYRCVINYADHLPITKDIRVERDEVADFNMAIDPTKPVAPKLLDSEMMITESISAKSIESVAVRSSRGGSRFGRKKSKAPVFHSLGYSSTSVASAYDSGGKVGSGKEISRGGALTAGEINDYSKWKMWQDLSDSELKSFADGWKIAPKGRYTLELRSQSGLPLADAVVELVANRSKVIYSARTDNTGKAELWYTTTGEEVVRSGLSMKINYRGQKKELKKVTPFDEGVNHLMMTVECSEINNVDIAFVVDATGSMGDELNYLKEEMNEIIFKSKQISSTLNFHFANVFYRDEGTEEYLTRTMDFSRILSESVQFINNQRAGGGGDYEEAVEVALDAAINDLNWNEEARTRIIFLILDAPPHNNEANQQKLNELMRKAAEKGIRIVPVGASGINKSTEYLMRTMAIATNGTYTFLTDHSGIGNSHIEPSTDEYEVETFNDILVRIVKSYTYMPDCEQNIPDLDLNYPDSLVSSVPFIDSLDTVDTNPRDSINVNIPDERPEVKWSYYPNPTNGIINVKADTDINELFITDLTGKLLQSIKKLEKDQVYRIDLSLYTTGIYLIRYLHEEKWITGKVVLQRY
ncbi:MAG: VWA domain-containing protein [Crocinitomicaceae bacterium]|nr:VWA domain-containing protein [Flavobacteriales bacterium]NQZ36243.1 VWA domain-containing protein [Crocinitomicaceae bacterium]